MREAHNIKVIVCRDRLSKWMNSNPVVREKELIAVLCPNNIVKYKIGDGKSHFRSLPFTKLSNIKNYRCYIAPRKQRYIEIDLIGDINEI